MIISYAKYMTYEKYEINRDIFPNIREYFKFSNFSNCWTEMCNKALIEILFYIIIKII